MTVTRTDQDRPSVSTPESDDLDACDGFVVLQADPLTGDLDCYGPYSGPRASAEADRRRDELLAEDLQGVAVFVVRHHDRR